MTPRPKVLIVNFPANPTAQCVNFAFFEKPETICEGYGV